MARDAVILWTPEEAWDYLNTRLHMDKMDPHDQALAVNDLMLMSHRPWCRTHMSAIAPSYGSDCTCDAAS